MSGEVEPTGLYVGRAYYCSEEQFISVEHRLTLGVKQISLQNFKDNILTGLQKGMDPQAFGSSFDQACFLEVQIELYFRGGKTFDNCKDMLPLFHASVTGRGPAFGSSLDQAWFLEGQIELYFRRGKAFNN